MKEGNLFPDKGGDIDKMVNLLEQAYDGVQND